VSASPLTSTILIRFTQIFWIDATNSGTIEASFVAISTRPFAQKAATQPSLSAVRQLISSLNEDWLLVFDGADHEAYFLKQYIPSGNYGNIIISSRNPHMKKIVHKALEISDMEEEDAVTLLLRSSSLDNSDTSLHRPSAVSIVRELCCMPLAIDQAGAYISCGLASLDQYLGLYHKRRAELSTSHHFEDQSDYGCALYTTWDISFREISLRASEAYSVKGKEAAAAIMLLHIFSFLHFEDIPEELFRRAATGAFNAHQKLDPHGILAHILELDDEMQWNSLLFRGGLYMLQSFSFLKSAGMVGAYTMHRLVHDWIQDRMSKDECLSTAKALNVLFTSSTTLAFGHSLEEIAFYRVLVPHITAYQISIQAIIPEWRETDISLLDRLGHTLFIMGSYQGAMALYLEAVGISKIMLGPNNVDTLASMNNLASTYSDLGEYQRAKELQLEVLEARKKVLGPGHVDTLNSMNNLASIYSHLGEYQRAKELNLQVLEAKKKVLGPNHVDTLRSSNNLALTYSSLGEYQRANELQLEVFEARKKVLGPDHVDTLTSMNNLASTYSDLGEYQRAKELNLQVLEARKKVLGLDHIDTLTSMGNLALTYFKLREYQKAEELHVSLRSKLEHQDSDLICPRK
jgi:tetratricopeptide (TPR) repeat protein